MGRQEKDVEFGAFY